MRASVLGFCLSERGNYEKIPQFYECMPLLLIFHWPVFEISHRFPELKIYACFHGFFFIVHFETL